MDKQRIQQQFEHYYQALQQQATNPVSLYLDSLAPTGRRAIRSALTMAACVLGFEGELETLPWALLDYQRIAYIRTTLQQQHKATNTINFTLCALRGVMKACFNLKLISADQLLAINQIKPARGQRLISGRSLTSKEVHKLLRVCQRDHSAIGLRDYAVMTVMLVTGLRRSELTALQLTDFNSRSGVLNIEAGKGNKQRQLYLNPDTRKVIRQWRAYRGIDDGWLFNPISKNGQWANRQLTGQGVFDIVQSRAQQAGIGVVRPHDLRRTFITHLLENGVDLNTTRQLAGH
jgi:integrase/recombinase XerD